MAYLTEELPDGRFRALALSGKAIIVVVPVGFREIRSTPPDGRPVCSVGRMVSVSPGNAGELVVDGISAGHPEKLQSDPPSGIVPE